MNGLQKNREVKNMLRIGNEVYDIYTKKYGTIISMECPSPYPMMVDFDDYRQIYTKSGTYNVNFELQILYPVSDIKHGVIMIPVKSKK